MASVRCTDVPACPTEFLDFMSLTPDEFQQLVPPFEAAFYVHEEHNITEQYEWVIAPLLKAVEAYKASARSPRTRQQRTSHVSANYTRWNWGEQCILDDMWTPPKVAASSQSGIRWTTALQRVATPCIASAASRR
jgi:hypothetical protein